MTRDFVQFYLKTVHKIFVLYGVYLCKVRRLPLPPKYYPYLENSMLTKIICGL